MIIKVLVADDHTLFRQGLRQLLEIEPDVEVVGEAKDGMEVQRKVEELRPDVVLMDINMPIVDGVAATKQILEANPDLGVIMLTMYRQDQHVFEAIRAGARGYLLKDCLSTEVVSAIRAVYGGASIIDPTVTTKVLREFQRLAHDTDPEQGVGQLTAREVAILRLVAAGYSNKEIALKLAFSDKTVKNHLTTIFQKLQIRDRTQAAIYALSQGLISPE